MPLWDTYLVNGVDLGSLARITEQWDGTLQAGARRGANVVMPGVPGEVFVPKVRATPTLTLGLAVLAADPATGAMPAGEADQVKRLNANLRDLVRLLDSSVVAPLTVTRRVSFPDHDEEHTALAELGAPMAPTLLGGARTARLTVELRILDGVWYATADGTATVTTAGVDVTCAGDTRTNRITATFDTGPATLTNAANGTHLTATSAGFIDVQELYAWSGVASGSLALDRGVNHLTVDTGTVALTWREAYL